MNITINNLVELDYFKGMKLIAGKSGINNTISNCGILDYEFDKALKGKYLYSNFHADQFVLTSFLYAKNNPYLILEAVKYLIGKGVCGLAVRNVFNLPIHESVIRYANSKGFPIFLLDDESMYFEEIIIKIRQFVKQVAQVDFYEQETDALIHQNFTPQGVKSCAYRINPSFDNQFIVFHFRSKEPLDLEISQNILSKYNDSQHGGINNHLYQYKSGFLLIISSDNLDMTLSKLTYESIIETLAFDQTLFSIGISNPHYRLNELDLGIIEALHSSLLHDDQNKLFTQYQDLGLYRVILPLIDDVTILNYSSNILDPLLDHDAEHKSNLFKTLHQLIVCRGSLHALSEVTGQHNNTLRYRLDKVAQVTGLHFRTPSDYEQLSFAIKVHIVKEKYI